MWQSAGGVSLMCDLVQCSNIGSQLIYLLETSSVYIQLKARGIYNENKFQLDILFRQQATDYQVKTLQDLFLQIRSQFSA